jgi:hypothetical protein
MSIHILEFNRLVWEYTISRFYQKFPVDTIFVFAIYGFLNALYQLSSMISWFYVHKILVKSISSFPAPDLIFENESETSETTQQESEASETETSEWETQSETTEDPPVEIQTSLEESDIEEEYRVVRKRQRNSI